MGQETSEEGTGIEAKGAIDKAIAFKREIEVKEDTTVKELMDEFHLSSAPIMLEVSGQIFNPKHIMDRRLRKGDKVTLLRLIAGG